MLKLTPLQTHQRPQLQAAAPVHSRTAASHAASIPMLSWGLSAVLAAQMSLAPLAVAQPDASVAPCQPLTPCVSTSSFQSPSQYLAPWGYAPTAADVAKRQLAQEVVGLGGEVISQGSAEDGIIRFRIPYAGKEDVDEAEFVFREADGLVLFRAQGTGLIGKAGQPPPACWTPGCVSGYPQRKHMEDLRDALGWTSLETDEGKAWVQILLH